MKDLSRLLGPALGRDEIVRTARAQMVLRRWPEIVGRALAQRSQPERFERGTVWVAVEGSAWAQELRLAKPQLLTKLRNMAGDEHLFTDIRFGVRTIDPLPDEPEPTVHKQRPQFLVSKDHHDDRSIREIAEARLQQWSEGE